MKVAGSLTRPEEIEFFLRLHGMWEGIVNAAAATLNFALYKEIDDGFDFLEVSVLDAADDSPLAVIDNQITGFAATWEQITYPLPAQAIGKTVKIEFRFTTDDLDSFSGAYIDDVQVTVP